MQLSRAMCATGRVSHLTGADSPPERTGPAGFAASARRLLPFGAHGSVGWPGPSARHRGAVCRCSRGLSVYSSGPPRRHGPGGVATPMCGCVCGGVSCGKKRRILVDM